MSTKETVRRENILTNITRELDRQEGLKNAGKFTFTLADQKRPPLADEVGEGAWGQ